ncbi:hypothetical protein ACJMK2_034391 [Sinanodonta woodiana]|uniref:Uncharacterized protein n=1 Tax=Sinanodonta woodiana TaxID=1069815 RepID=A0ABD3WRD7_SINWO
MGANIMTEFVPHKLGWSQCHIMALTEVICFDKEIAMRKIHLVPVKTVLKSSENFGKNCQLLIIAKSINPKFYLLLNIDVTQEQFGFLKKMDNASK